MTAEPLYCEIRHYLTNFVESAAICDTPIECFEWYREHGIAMSLVTMTENGFTCTPKPEDIHSYSL